MKKLTSLLLLISLPILAQKTEKRSVGAFTGVEVTAHFEVKLTTSGSDILIATDKPEYLKNIKTEVSGETLKIWADGTVKGDVEITVPYKTLNEVVLNGSGDITADGTVSTNEIKVAVNGSGDINLDIATTNIKASVTGSGDLVLKGTAENFKANVVGSGDLAAGGLKAKNVQVKVVGSGDATVYASEALKAQLSGSGDIRYKGDPKLEDTKVDGSGSITKD